MSHTLKEISHEVLKRLPNAIGRQESIASITTTTVVVSALANGGFSSQRFTQEFPWMLRRDTASSGDRVRYCTDFTSSTGTLTHAGANYSDTTATGESVELLRYEPKWLDAAIQVAIQRLHRRDREILPTLNGERRYWIGDLDWIRSPSDIIKVSYTNDPVYSRNRDFEKWNAVDSSGVPTADWWTLAGTSATAVRSTTARKGRYSVALTRAGTDLTYTQTVSLGITGVDNDALFGHTLTVVLVGKTSTASQLRVEVSDGTQTVTSSYHSGGGGWESLTAQITVDSAATALTIYAAVKTSDGTAYVDECYITENYDDATKRNSWPETDLKDNNWGFDQGNGTLALILPEMGRNAQYIVYSKRPYPGFDETRLVAGTADADSTDAPLIPVVCGAIARLFGGLADGSPNDGPRNLAIAQQWEERFNLLAMEHMGVDETPKGGLDLPRAVGAGPRRF